MSLANSTAAATTISSNFHYTITGRSRLMFFFLYKKYTEALELHEPQESIVLSYRAVNIWVCNYELPYTVASRASEPRTG